MNGRHVSTCIQFAFTPGDTSGYKWIQMDTCIQRRAVFYSWIQVDTDTFCIRYKWIHVLLGGYKWIQVLDTTCIQLYPFRCKRSFTVCCVPKHVTTSSTISWTRTARFRTVLIHLTVNTKTRGRRPNRPTATLGANDHTQGRSPRLSWRSCISSRRRRHDMVPRTETYCELQRRVTTLITLQSTSPTSMSRLTLSTISTDGWSSQPKNLLVASHAIYQTAPLPMTLSDFEAHLGLRFEHCRRLSRKLCCSRPTLMKNRQTAVTTREIKMSISKIKR